MGQDSQNVFSDPVPQFAFILWARESSQFCIRSSVVEFTNRFANIHPLSIALEKQKKKFLATYILLKTPHIYEI